MNLEDKLFLLTVGLGLAWIILIILANPLNIDRSFITNIERLLNGLVGAFIASYATTRKGENHGKKR